MRDVDAAVNVTHVTSALYLSRYKGGRTVTRSSVRAIQLIGKGFMAFSAGA